MLPTFLLWTFLTLLVADNSLQHAWLEALARTGCRFCDSLGYKLFHKVIRRQPRLRPTLCQLVAPPPDPFIHDRSNRDPCCAQLREHLRIAFPQLSDPIGALQALVQKSFF